MRIKACCSVRLGLILLAGVFVAGCSSFDGASSRIAGMVSPYKVDVVQGNFVSREQVQALQPGMSRQQVREILGTPLVTSLFHADRWEYVFTIKRPGQDLETRKLTAFFKGEALDRAEGDEMPTETDFVASLGARNVKPKVPSLEATPEQLAKYPPSQRPSTAPTAAPLEPGSVSYPPLEAPAR